MGHGPHSSKFLCCSMYCLFCVVLCTVCKCVLYYCHLVATQLQLTSILYHTSTYLRYDVSWDVTPSVDEYNCPNLPVLLNFLDCLTLEISHYEP